MTLNDIVIAHAAGVLAEVSVEALGQAKFTIWRCVMRQREAVANAQREGRTLETLLELSKDLGLYARINDDIFKILTKKHGYTYEDFQ